MATCMRIARNVLLGVALGCCAATGFGQTAQDAPAQITISIGSTTFAAGAEISAQIHLANTSGHPLNTICTAIRGYPDWRCYDFQITNESGVVLKRKEGPRATVGSADFESLQPGQSEDIVNCMSCQYDGLDVPGKYRIFTVRDFAEARVESNEITITVMPKPQGGRQ